MKTQDMTLPWPPPKKIVISPDATLPPGLTDPKFERFGSDKLDYYFASKAAQLSHHYLDMVKIAMEKNCNTLAWEFAKASAHWKRIDEDLVAGVQLVNG